MDYPVYIGGIRCGSLKLHRIGLYTYFTADCEARSGIVRLFVYGDGKKAALGTLCPQNGRLCLEKRFSQNELRRFPKKIEYAADEKLDRNENAEEGLLWFENTDGSLVSHDGESTLTAIPVKGHLGAGRVGEIGGKSYMIFIRKRNLR